MHEAFDTTMFFKAKLGCSFYRSVLVILTCLSISSNPQNLKNSLRKCNSTITNGNCSSLPTNANKNTTNTNGTEKESTRKFLTKEDKTKVLIASMCVTAMGTLLNFVVVVAITTDPLKILRKGPWVTILNLAMADLTTSISYFFLSARFFFAENKLFYEISLFGSGFGSFGSFLWLTFLSFQIFVITKFPVKSRYWFTTIKIVLIGIAIWLIVFFLGLCELAYLFLPNTMSLKIWIAGIGVLQVAVVIQIVFNIQVTFEIIRSGRSSGNPQNAKHKNIAMTVIILTLILFLTAFPYFLLKQLELLARLGFFDHDKTRILLRALSYCYEPIAMLNFAANPVLYALRLPDYTQTLLAFVGKSNGSRRNSAQNRSSAQITNTFSLRRQRASTMSERSEWHST